MGGNWEGGKVGVVPGTACGGVQNRPPGTESPSRYWNTLWRGEGGRIAILRGLRTVESVFYRR